VFSLGVKHINTTPYYAQESLAERVNRNLKSALNVFHHNSHKLSDEDLPWLGFAFNTASHESTNATPDSLFLGREIISPLECRRNLSTEDAKNSVSGTDLSFWTRAYRNLKAARNRAAHIYNNGRKAHSLKFGDPVMYKIQLVSCKPHNLTSKLMVRWSEPVIIAKTVNGNNVLLANTDTGVFIRRAHVSQLKA